MIGGGVFELRVLNQ